MPGTKGARGGWVRTPPEAGSEGSCHPALRSPPLSSPSEGQGAGVTVTGAWVLVRPWLTWAVQSTASLGPEDAEHRRRGPWGGWGWPKVRRSVVAKAQPVPGPQPASDGAQEVTVMAEFAEH